MEVKNIFVFCDFDGTILKQDIGDELFKDLGKFEPFHTKLINKELSISEYWRSVFKTLPDSLTNNFIESYIDKFDFDPYFKDFAKFCDNNNISLSIISDGFDFYIEPFLKKFDLNRIRLFCNKAVINSVGQFEPEFTNQSESCNCFCASCKRNTILTHVPENEIIIFIGDGYSDYCAAEHSDIIFAKKNLAAYCNDKRIPHYPFSNFFDIIRIFSGLLKKGSIRQRHQAKLLRKKAFETE